jgi:hypothetical protein
MAGECREIVVDDADNKCFFYSIPTLRRQVGGLGLKCNSRTETGSDAQADDNQIKIRNRNLCVQRPASNNLDEDPPLSQRARGPPNS